MLIGFIYRGRKGTRALGTGFDGAQTVQVVLTVVDKGNRHFYVADLDGDFLNFWIACGSCLGGSGRRWRRRSEREIIVRVGVRENDCLLLALRFLAALGTASGWFRWWLVEGDRTRLTLGLDGGSGILGVRGGGFGSRAWARWAFEVSGPIEEVPATSSLLQLRWWSFLYGNWSLAILELCENMSNN
jgi:hypothetical protein